MAERIHPSIDYFLDKKTGKADFYSSKNEYKHNWGEKHEAFYNLELFLYSLDENKVEKVEGIPENLRVTTPKFLGNRNSEIIFCGIEGEFASGYYGCLNKDSSIYLIDSKTGNSLKKISQDPIAYYPISNPDGSKILFLFTSEYTEKYAFPAGLKCYELSTGEEKILVSEKDTYENPSFNLCVGSTSSKIIWNIEGNLMIFLNVEKSQMVLNNISLINGERKKLIL